MKGSTMRRKGCRRKGRKEGDVGEVGEGQERDGTMAGMGKKMIRRSKGWRGEG